MHKLSNILGASNMTPKERILAQVKHYLNLERTGVEILSEADIEALSNSWKPRHPGEVSEYNKYLSGMKTENLLRTEVQFAYLQAQLKLTRVSRVLDYAMFSGYKNNKGKDLLLLDGDVSAIEASDFITQNSGFNYDTVIEGHPEMKVEIDTLIQQGKLTIFTFEEQIIDLKRTVNMITGESICTLPDTHILKINYTKQVEYYIYFACVFLFIQKSNLFKIYGELLAVQDIYKVLVDIYEADIDYYLYDLIKELDDSLEQLNKEIMFFLSRLEDELYNISQPKFFLEVQIQNILLKKSEKDYSGKIYNKYLDALKVLFFYEFK